MADKNRSLLLSDVKIKGNLIDKETIIIDGEVTGNINADILETHINSNIRGDVIAKDSSISGKLYG